MTKNNDDEQVILEFGVQTFTLTDYTRYQEMVLMRIIKACQSDISDAITSYKNNTSPRRRTPSRNVTDD